MVEQLSFETLPQALGVLPGITAVVGSGGKTSLLAALAQQLSGTGGAPGATVVLATSTRIYPFEKAPLYTGGNADELRRLLASRRVACCGAPAADGKLAAPALGFTELARCADYVLVEADGSKRLPLKAHAAHEPAVPRGTARTIVVAGSAGFGLPVRAAVHRPELFCQRAGCGPDDEAAPERVARVLQAERLLSRLPNPCVMVSQVDIAERLAGAERLSRALGTGVLAVSIPNRLLYRVR